MTNLTPTIVISLAVTLIAMNGISMVNAQTQNTTNSTDSYYGNTTAMPTSAQVQSALNSEQLGNATWASEQILHRACLQPGDEFGIPMCGGGGG